MRLGLVMMVMERPGSLHGGRRQCVFQLQPIEFLRQRRRRRVLCVRRTCKQPVVGDQAPRSARGTLCPSASTGLDLDHRRLGRLGEADLSLQSGAWNADAGAAARRKAVAARQRVEVAAVSDGRVV